MNSLPAIRTSLLALLATTAIAGCARQPAPATTIAAAATSTTSADDHTLPSGIDWFEGGVDAAFAASRKSGKPVLLYWGAVWCPPCHLLKATLFSREDFQQKAKLFIPVYLDGDEPGAQKWGETFGVTGYPSVVILNGDRTEILRIAGGQDLTQYTSMLDTALEDRRPVHEVLGKLARANAQAAAEDCHRIAWQSWSLEDLDRDARRARGRQLAAAEKACATSGTPEERERITVFAAADLGLAGDAASSKLPAALVAQVGDLLADPTRAMARADALRSLDEGYFATLRAQDAARAATQLAQYLDAMRAGSESTSLPLGDRLNLLYSAVLASRSMSPDGKPAPAIEQLARARVAKAVADPGPASERSGTLNGALNVLDALRDNQQAYDITLREVKTAGAPYYYMSSLGDYCEAMGRPDEALQWHARAYEQSRGAATRFQWGGNYLQALLRLAPGDVKRVQEAGLAVLGELDAPDAIYRRSRIRLAKLDASLREWVKQDASRAPTAHALRERVKQTCGRLAPADPASATCRAFASG